MPSTLVILNLADIAAALPLKQRPELANGELQVLVFDPALVDRAVDAGLGPVECLRWDDAPLYRQLNDSAHATARELERSLDAEVQRLWPSDVRALPRDLQLGSWQHLSLYYLHMALHWYAGLFAALVPRLQGRRLLLSWCDNPQSLYFPSFVPATLLIRQAQLAGIEFQAFTYNNRPPSPQAVPDLREALAPGLHEFVLTHLPTCLYDGTHLQAELQATGLQIVNLKAKYWDIPLQADRTVDTVPVDDAMASLDEAERQLVERVTQGLFEPLERHLSRWLVAPQFRARQARQIAELYRAQLVTFLLLERHFAATAPGRLLLSDHDTDFHGPLTAYARSHQIPIVVLPHSKTSTDLDFPARQVTLLYHPVQGETVYDLDGRRPAQHFLDYPFTLHFDNHQPARVATVGLLLNGTSLNGVPGIDIAAYDDGVRRILQWCEQLGLKLLVRSRPGNTLFTTLLGPAGLSKEQQVQSTAGSMADFAQRCDLCLMYDAPTSGAIELLSRGVATLNPVATGLTCREAGSMDTGIVPRAPVEDSLIQAATLVKDPQAFRQFRLQQMLAFAQRCAQATGLRAFL